MIAQERNSFRWTKEQYYKMAEVGILKPDEGVELIEGVVMVKFPEPKARRWTKEEYYKMAELGWFDGKHVELMEGEILEMSPIGSLHASGVDLTAQTLRASFGQEYFLRTHQPFEAGEPTEPEPDVAVVAGSPRDYKEAHPTTAALIVEVAETSLDYDRTYKASLYAKAGIEEYWIVNLIERQLEVHRQPAPMPDQPLGYGYMTVTILTEAESVSPLAASHAVIAVRDLLP